MPLTRLPRAVAIGAAALVLTFAVPSSYADAATFNFNALADNGINTTGGTPANGVGEGFWDTKAALSSGYVVGGIRLDATASGTASSRAYLDDPDGGFAGLGVCSLTACAGTSDDNIGRAGDVNGGTPETLILKFDKLVNLTGAFFGNRDHGAFGTAATNGRLLINGVLFHVVGGSIVAADLPLLVALGAQTEFEFASTAGDSNRLKRDFYLTSLSAEECTICGNTDVPIPGALPLFASGVALLGGFVYRRRRRALSAAV